MGVSRLYCSFAEEFFILAVGFDGFAKRLSVFHILISGRAERAFRIAYQIYSVSGLRRTGVLYIVSVNYKSRRYDKRCRIYASGRCLVVKTDISRYNWAVQLAAGVGKTLYALFEFKELLGVFR